MKHVPTLSQISRLTQEDLQDQYGIEVSPADGSVWDSVEQTTYQDLSEWYHTCLAEGDSGGFIPSKTKGWTHDD